MTKQMKTTSKRAMARKAQARGRKTFLAVCSTHSKEGKRVWHYAKGSKCVQCQAEKDAKKAERRRTDPEYAAHQRALQLNKNTRRRLRELGRPETAMPKGEQLAECLEFAKGAPVGAEMDHAVPLRGFDPMTGEWTVSGLHVAWNLEPMEPRSNRRKNSTFDPETLWFQRPYNSYPGGQFHGDFGEIEFMRYTVDGGVALELVTVEEFKAMMIEMGNEAMEQATATGAANDSRSASFDCGKQTNKEAA
ncbi:hypothetical protein UB46_17095 [Burkholderiaceae bacterium 16]|nr:hypothetical protein UB46_17095 [Burkholderiaceae bacterium 16]